MLGSIVLLGGCMDETRFVIEGVLLATTDPAQFSDHWITFQYVDRLVVEGNGTLDGQGASGWPYNDCNKNPNCKPLPAVSYIHLHEF